MLRGRHQACYDAQASTSEPTPLQSSLCGQHSFRHSQHRSSQRPSHIPCGFNTHIPSSYCLSSCGSKRTLQRAPQYSIIRGLQPQASSAGHPASDDTWLPVASDPAFPEPPRPTPSSSATTSAEDFSRLTAASEPVAASQPPPSLPDASSVPLQVI